MAAVPQIDILAYKRVPFDDTIIEVGVDYSGATAAMEIRAEPGDQGSPLIELGMSVAGGQGIAITHDAAYPDPETGTPGDASTVRIIINETTLEGVGYGVDPEAPLTLHYDLHLTPASGKKFIFARGLFILSPGVTL